MNRYKQFARFIAFLILAVPLLSGCGRDKGPSQTIVNYTLKPVEETDFSEFNTAGKTDSPTSAAPEAKWMPKGNYTYVLSSPTASDEYSSVLIRVDSCNFKTNEAKLAWFFVKGQQDSKPLSSDGIVACKMTCEDSSDGKRHIVITIDDSSVLKLDGTQHSHTAKFIRNGRSYSLKYEG